MRHGNAGVSILVLLVMAGALFYACQSPTPEDFSPAPDNPPAVLHLWPHFDCQEDEIMQWVDARHTAECVNVEEFLAREGHNGH